MKRCPFCGAEYPDGVDVCVVDHTPLQPIGAAQLGDSALPNEKIPNEKSGSTISPQEQRFWNRMTFKDFAALFLRFQALWLFFNALIEITYLSRFFDLSSSVSSYSGLSPAAKFDLFMSILRIIIHVAVGLAIIQHAEKVLSWLVKDLATNQPPKNDNRAT